MNVRFGEIWENLTNLVTVMVCSRGTPRSQRTAEPMDVSFRRV